MLQDIFTRPGEEKPDLPPIIEAVLLILAIMLGIILGLGLNALWGMLFGFDPSNIKELIADNPTAAVRNYLRLSALTSNGLMFIFPALFFSWFFYRKRWAQSLQLTSVFRPSRLPWLVVFVFAGFFFSQFTFWLNQMLPLPESALKLEEQTAGLIEAIITMESLPEFLFALLTVAVVPAVGEELLFRGIIQHRLEEISRRPHLAIIVTAILFSFIHFQFAGFLPRIVLGLLLGYIFYWTRNLWMSILAHFLINGVQVATAFFMKNQIENIEKPDLTQIPASQMLLTAAISLIFIYLAGNWFHKHKERTTEISASEI